MIQQHYSTILGKSEAALVALTNDQSRYSKFVAAHNNAADLDSLERFVAGRTEANMYKLARIEYQHALYAAAFAQYRQAHVSLRLFFELSLSGVLFSAHEIDAHLWLKGRKDSNWSAISSNETGVFSKNFVGAFFEEMKEYCPQYLTMAVAVYRECSEFVHGNRSSFDGIESDIQFNSNIIDGWMDRADTIILLVKLSFFIRYLPHAEESIRNEFEQMALEAFGNLPPIQAIYAGEPA